MMHPPSEARMDELRRLVDDTDIVVSEFDRTDFIAACVGRHRQLTGAEYSIAIDARICEDDKLRELGEMTPRDAHSTVCGWQADWAVQDAHVRCPHECSFNMLLISLCAERMRAGARR